jgi:Lon protease-like protein
VTALLPLFPLGSVLFPGLVMPLHVFEERYRSLVRDLINEPGPLREFGVVAIRRGWEVEGATLDGSVSLYDVGCSAELREVTEHDDGRFDVVTVGRRRFEILELVPTEAPYLTARVRYLTDPADTDGSADSLSVAVLAVFQNYLRLVRTGASASEQLPDDPAVLANLVGATAALTLDDRQRLLAAPDTAARLRLALELLGREVALLGHVRAVPLAVSALPVVPGPN